MSIKDPSTEIIASVQGAVFWLRSVQIGGVRLETVKLEVDASSGEGIVKIDRRLTSDPDAPPLWARFYDLEDNTVLLANRDGVRVVRFEEVHPERRAGYSWYGTWAEKLLAKDYPIWECRVIGARGDGSACP